MHTKIVLPADKSLEQLQRDIELGGRFVVYQYCISILFAVTLRRFSPAYFIEAGVCSKQFARKYNWITSICGWWGIPHGISTSFKSLDVNGKGGVDVTADILANLTPENLETRDVNMERAGLLFSQPKGDELKAFKKSIGEKLLPNQGINNVILGLYLNTGNADPIYVVGIDASIPFEDSIRVLQELLYKQFRKHVPFEFVDLSDTDEFIDALKLQGLRLNQLQQK